MFREGRFTWLVIKHSVLFFFERLVNVREQGYEGHVYYLIDFWNGTGEYPIDANKPVGYNSLKMQSANR